MSINETIIAMLDKNIAAVSKITGQWAMDCAEALSYAKGATHPASALQQELTAYDLDERAARVFRRVLGDVESIINQAIEESRQYWQEGQTT